KYVENEGNVEYTLEDVGFVDKLCFKFNSAEDFMVDIKYQKYSDFDKLGEAEIIEKYYTALNQSVINLEKNIEKVTFIVPADKALDYIEVYNNFTFNKYIFVYLVAVFIALFLVIDSSMKDENLHKVFFASAILLGILMIVLRTQKFKSWDEQIHFQHAEEVSYNRTVMFSVSSYNMATIEMIPDEDTYEEKQNLENYLDVNEDIICNSKEKSSGYIDYTRKAYIPQAIGLYIGRKLNIPYGKAIWLAKFLNLLTYTLAFTFAIKYAKIGKRLVYAIGLLPTSLYIATSFSYDAVVTSFVTLGLVLAINEIASKEDKINPLRIICSVIAISFGSFAKAVYIPYVLILLMIPKKKFYSKKQRVMFMGGLLLVFMIVMSTFILPTLTNTVNNVDEGGDYRGGDTSVTRQMQSIFENPIAYSDLLIGNIEDSFGEFYLGSSSSTFFAYIGEEKGNIYFLHFIMIILLIMTEGSYESIAIDKKQKIVFGILTFSIACLIWTALYLSFTPVKAESINGVQARYYIPLFLPTFLIFRNKIFDCKVDLHKYNKAIGITCNVVLMYVIYNYMLVRYCL
ncbi:MAG: DUF2142 domain-containing protein, partial [Lachnospiraceae bacterium]|nr:DUF2142 domain-containing protein [Lachnospiraceae bacterium]